MNFEANNVVILEGTIETCFKFDHKYRDISFYCFTLAVKRPSGTIDYIPCSVSSKIIGNIRDRTGRSIKIIGKFNSYEKQEHGKSRVIVQVNVLNMELISPKEVDENTVFLVGKVMNVSKTRITATGRLFSCIRVAVTKNNNKRDFFSVVLWKDKMDETKSVAKGMDIKLVGRIETRMNNERTVCKVATKKIELSESDELAS